jgi:hypothetical protein
MTEHSLVLLVCLGIIVVLDALLYAAGRGYLAALTGIGELRGITAQILAHAQNVDLSLNQQRRVLYDAHKRLCAVTKGAKKPAS